MDPLLSPEGNEHRGENGHKMGFPAAMVLIVGQAAAGYERSGAAEGAIMQYVLRKCNMRVVHASQGRIHPRS